MTTTVRLPDGSNVDVATDDPKQAAAAARKHWEAKRPSTTMDAVRGAVGSVVDNLTPNWGDEIAGAGSWIGAKLGINGKDPKTAFKEGQEDFKADQDRFKREHPVISKITAGAGLVGSLAIPVGRVAEGASLATRMAHGAAVGAGYGAVSGAGEGEDLSERAGNAVRSGAAGAVVGSVAAPLTDAAVSAARKARMVIPGADTALRTIGNVPRAVMRRPLVGPGQRAVEQADRMIDQHMNRGNIQRGMGETGPVATPAAIAAEHQARTDMGVVAMPGDTTEPLRHLTSFASRGMGPGQTRVILALDARKAQEADRVRQHVIDTMGPVGDPVRQMEDHIQAAKDAVAPLYEKAYAQPMVVTPDIQGIMQTPAFREALPAAHRNILNAQRDPNAMGLRLVPHTPGKNLPPNVPHMVTPEGVYMLHDGLSTEGYDQVIRAMRDSGRAAMDTNGIRPVDTTNSVHINARARDLREHLAAQNEPYREAVRRYGDDMAQRDAFEAGHDVRKLTGHEINAQARNMPDQAQPAFAMGARTALADDASAFGSKFPTGDTAAHVRKALGDPVKQDAIGRMDASRPGAVRSLQDRLEAEHQGNILWKEVQGNSRTASRQALDRDAEDQVRPLSSLSVRGMAGKVISHIADRASTQFRNDVKARIAQVMTETNPATVRDLMAEIAARAQRDRAFAGLLHRSGVLGTKSYANNIVPNRADDNN